MADPDQRAFLDVEQSLSGNRWADRLDLRGRNEALAISQTSDIPEIVARVLAGRGVTADEAEGFLAPTLRDLMPDPSTLTAMDEAAGRIAAAISAGERVAIFGDYDVDGAVSAALLARFLSAFGISHEIYIPDRIFEGYGPNPEAIRQLIDNGANADCKAEYLYQFGVMGSLYVERVLGIKNPRVALVSNGEEEGKGNQLIKEAIPLLENSGLNYIGNIEPKEFMYGGTDVAVTDGFTGNIMMKMAEATARYMSDLLRENIKANPIAAVGGLLAKSAFGRVRKVLDPNEVGGAPLLGINGVVIIGHGRSNAYAIKQAVGQAKQVAENDVVTAIAKGI